jgi:hypothetical protein
MKYPGQSKPIHGRGASYNTPNRFLDTHHEVELDCSDLPDDERPPPQTRYYRDALQSIIAHNDSPDIGFNASINPYRGCLNGCICYRVSPAASLSRVQHSSASSIGFLKQAGIFHKILTSPHRSSPFMIIVDRWAVFVLSRLSKRWAT